MLKNQYKILNKFNNIFFFGMLNPGLWIGESMLGPDSNIGIVVVGAIDIFMKYLIFFTNFSPPQAVVGSALSELAFLWLEGFLRENSIGLSSINLTNLSFNELEPIIPLLLKYQYFKKSDYEQKYFDFDKIYGFLTTCLENEKHEHIKELFAYIVKNSAGPEDHIIEACKKFIEINQDKKTFSLKQLLIFLENTSSQFPEYKILERTALLINKVDFSDDGKINELKEFADQISKELQENLFGIIKNNLVNESKKTDDYSSEKIQKIQELLKYFIEKHKLPFEKIIMDNFKNLRMENILSLNKNLKIYCHSKANRRNSPNYDKEKDISEELFHNWVSDNVETEINFFKENVDYILNLGMQINQFNSLGETVLDHIKEEGKSSGYARHSQEIRLLNPVRPSNFKDKIEYLKTKGAKSFFRLFREYILEKVYSSLQGALFANRFLKTYSHYSKKDNKNKYYISMKKEIMAKILDKKNSKISVVDFFKFLFNSCSNIKYFDSIYKCATEYLITNPSLANTTPYNFWGQWFFGLVNRIYFANEEPELTTSHEFLKRFLELKLPFNVEIHNERGENAFHFLALSCNHEFIQTILQNCNSMIDAQLITKEQIKSLLNQEMEVRNNKSNLHSTNTDPLNLARNQSSTYQEDKYQKTVAVIEKYLGK